MKHWRRVESTTKMENQKKRSFWGACNREGKLKGSILRFITNCFHKWSERIQKSRSFLEIKRHELDGDFWNETFRFEIRVPSKSDHWLKKYATRISFHLWFHNQCFVIPRTKPTLSILKFFFIFVFV